MAYAPGTRFIVNYPGYGLHLLIQLDRDKPEMIGFVSAHEARIYTRPLRGNDHSTQFSNQDVAWARRITAEIQDDLNDDGEATDHVSHFIDHRAALGAELVEIGPCPA